MASLTTGVIGFAAGLVGYGLFALLSRAMYAAGATAATALACVSGWVVVIVADLLLSDALATTDRVLALALGNSIGMTVLGAALLVVVARTAGAPALSGVGRVGVVSLAAAVVAALLGRGIAHGLDGGGIGAAILAGVAVGVATAVVYTGLVLLGARAAVLSSVGSLRRADSIHAAERTPHDIA